MANRLSVNDSQFISAVRISMIIGLVFHHLFEIPGSEFYPRSSLNLELLSPANILNALFHWSTMAAVPLLSILSGYLYFARPKVDHRPLLVKRVKTVILPSLSWTTFWFISGAALAWAARPLDMLQWLAYDAGNLTWLPLLNGIVGITAEPLAIQFWFIHDLALTLMLVPLLGWLLQRFGYVFLVVLTLIWFADAVPFPFFRGNVLYFFCVGGFFAMCSLSLTHLALSLRRWKLAVIACFGVLVVARMFADMHPLFASYFWLCLLRISGVAVGALLIAIQLQSSHSWLHWLSRFSPYAFFIFAAHYPLIEIIKTISGRIPLHATNIGQLLTLVFVPAITVALCIGAARLTNRLAPNLFAFINGGRELHSSVADSLPRSPKQQISPNCTYPPQRDSG